MTREEDDAKPLNEWWPRYFAEYEKLFNLYGESNAKERKKDESLN